MYGKSEHSPIHREKSPIFHNSYILQFWNEPYIREKCPMFRKNPGNSHSESSPMHRERALYTTTVLCILILKRSLNIIQRVLHSTAAHYGRNSMYMLILNRAPSWKEPYILHHPYSYKIGLFWHLAHLAVGMYIHTNVCTCMYIYIYIYIYNHMKIYI